MRYLAQGMYDETTGYGFTCSFNPTLHQTAGDRGWISPWHFGLNQGPIVLMIENYRSELMWRLMRRCPAIVKGLQRAGFSGGWLNQETEQVPAEKDVK